MICIIDCGTSRLEEIKQNFHELGYKFRVIKIDKVAVADFKSYSGIIISGAPTLLSQIDLEKYLKPFKFIKTVDVPILGICLGHQIIGLIYGSEIHSGKLVDKKEQIEIVNVDKLFLGIENHAIFREEHSEFITLPKEFYLLAKSTTCDNEAMKHKQKEIYSTQFHPEASSSNGKKIFDNFLSIC